MAELTPDQAKFLQLFTGNKDNSFDSVRAFMEKEQPELWEECLDYLATYADSRLKRYFTDILNAQLDLHNLRPYLCEHGEEWKWIECKTCNGEGFLTDSAIRWGYNHVQCPMCKGYGKIKSPAYLFAVECGW